MTGSVPRCNGCVGSFCDEQPRNGSSREMRLEELTSLLPPLWRFPRSGERIMKNILPPLLQRCHWTKNIRKKKPKHKKPQGCSVMQLPGRGWREGRAAPSDSSGEEDAQREQLNYSQGIKGTGTHSLQPPASVSAFPLLFAWLGTAPPSTQNSQRWVSPWPLYIHTCCRGQTGIPAPSPPAAPWPRPCPPPFPQTGHSAPRIQGWMRDLSRAPALGVPCVPWHGSNQAESLEWGIRAWTAAGAEEGWHPRGSFQPNTRSPLTRAAAGAGWQPRCHTWCKPTSRWESCCSIPAASAKSKSSYSCHWSYQWSHLRLFSFFSICLLFSAAVASQ